MPLDLCICGEWIDRATTEALQIDERFLVASWGCSAEVPGDPFVTYGKTVEIGKITAKMSIS
jgi:hypothetical protein